MNAWRSSWVGPLLASLVLAACAGGRGSSGLDISELRVIEQVLSTGECGDHRQLVICPADEVATPTSSTSPTPTPTADLPSPTPATATPTATVVPHVDTGIGQDVSVPCVPDGGEATCTVTFTFTPQGFPVGTTYHVVSRRVSPDSLWALAPESSADGEQPTTFQAMVPFQLLPAGMPYRAQFAVLVFAAPPQPLPGEIAALADTGAEYAFVTQTVLVRLTTTMPSPHPSPAGTPLPPESGPQVTYFGIARADDVPLTPVDNDSQGRPVYVHPTGHGLSLVIEARPGTDSKAVGRLAVGFDGDAPDLQLLVSRPLGDGNPLVCDIFAPSLGGVPATASLEFSSTPAVIDAMNDLGCRANDGTGNPAARSESDACTQDKGGHFGFVEENSAVQFCLPIASAWAFAKGDTIVAGRVRDVGGTVGLVREIVVRVGTLPPPPTPTPTVRLPTVSPTVAPTTAAPQSPSATSAPQTPTPTPTATATPVSPADGPQLTYFGVARADGLTLSPSEFDEEERPVYRRPLGQGIILIVEAMPGSTGRAVGPNTFDPSGGLPDLQVLVSRPLGNGSTAVCDIAPENIGGVPGTNPPDFNATVTTADAINDLGCRVNDGTGMPLGRITSGDACTRSDGDNFGFAFVDPDSTIQYCFPIASAWAFPAGETIVAARVRDIDGAVGLSSEIVVEVGRTPTPAI
jgi:hypothetical protein